MTGDAPTFANAADEARHWKARVDEMRTALLEAENGLQEFMESSKELEAEMEADMAASRQRADTLQAENEQLRADVDEWRSKYQKSIAEHNAALGDLHTELSKLRETHDAYKTRLRDMELDNDALENAERMINSSLADMEARYHKAMERTALLETELEGKSRLEMENQRLKDELRDVREELHVQQAKASVPVPLPRSDPDELTLSDLVVQRPVPPSSLRLPTVPVSGGSSSGGSTLERLREHMHQLQQRLQHVHTAQAPTTTSQFGRAARSSLPRPRSSMSASTGGPPSCAQHSTGPSTSISSPVPWRSATPSSYGTPSRSESRNGAAVRGTPAGSGIPVPVGGLSRSQSRTRPPSRLASDAHPSPAGSRVPYEFMEHDPAASPLSRSSSMARRRSFGPTSLPTPSRPRVPSSRTASPTKMRPVSPGVVSPSKTRPVSPGLVSPSKRAPVPWR